MSQVGADKLEQTRQLSRWAIAIAWLLAGVCLLAFLNAAPANRAQEARVLVTAREMAQEGGERWLLPTCNGALRVQKPPMAYWGAAATFLATGRIDELTGRLPSVLWAWLLLGVVYSAGRRWFSQEVGLLGAGMLLTSFLVYRYGRLAETDIPATLAVAAAVVAFWRGLEASENREAGGRAALWCAAGGAAMGVAFLAKQGPGAYPLLFALAFGIVRRNWRGLATVAWSGLIPALLVAVPWYAYVVARGYGGVLSSEAAVAAEGRDHGGSVFDLVPQLAMATAPWCGLWPAAVVLGWLQRRRPAVQGLLCWAGATLLPLLFVGNRQIHYLMPAMPPLMLLSAWMVEQAVRGVAPRPLRAYVALAMHVLMWGAMVAGVVALGWAGAMAAGFARSLHPGMAWPTAVLGLLMLVAGLALVRPLFSGRILAAAMRATVGVAAVFVWLLGVWAVQLEETDLHDVAQTLRKEAGERRLVFYGEPSLSLVFQMGQVIPAVGQKSQLPALVTEGPALLLQAEPKDPPADLPKPWHLAWRGGPKGHHFQLWIPESGNAAPEAAATHP